MGEARASPGASGDHIITDRGKRNEPFPLPYVAAYLGVYLTAKPGRPHLRGHRRWGCDLDSSWPVDASLLPVLARGRGG